MMALCQQMFEPMGINPCRVRCGLIYMLLNVLPPLRKLNNIRTPWPS